MGEVPGREKFGKVERTYGTCEIQIDSLGEGVWAYRDGKPMKHFTAGELVQAAEMLMED